MTPTGTDVGPPRAAALRQARAIRTRTIRRRVIAGALSMFVATWLLITLMLVSGHDPALAARQASSQATAARAATTDGATSTGSGTTDGASGGAGAATTGSGATSSVTTQQS